VNYAAKLHKFDLNQVDETIFWVDKTILVSKTLNFYTFHPLITLSRHKKPRTMAEAPRQPLPVIIVNSSSWFVRC